MKLLQPTIPFHGDEVTQGYFARIGYLQAGVDVGHFCKFFDLARTDFRDGTGRCIEVISAVSGADTDQLRFNAVQPLPDGTVNLRGEALGLQVVRRVTVKFCPRCLLADEEAVPSLGKAAWRFRWSWLLKPVVVCPFHNFALVSVPAKDAVNAFDLRKLFAQNDLNLTLPEGIEPVLPGSLQRYVVSRLSDRPTACPWLDNQGVAEGVRACEMVGSLICDGPTVEIKSYTDLDWSRVGSAGFDVCCHGPEAIKDVLSKVRLDGGRRSGRAGPQAAFGPMFKWLRKSERVGEEGPIRDVVRDAIIDNFAVGPGEVVLGHVVDRRKVHSVNSLANATGLNRFRLYRIIQKAGMIPEDASGSALNQFVFPAEQAEQFIAQIQNSIPLNQVPDVLGCSVTHAENLANSGFISSIVPMKEGDVGLTRGYFNLPELSKFLDDVSIGTNHIKCEVDGFLNLTHAARGRSTTAQIIGWQVDGSLQRTRLLGGVKRLDNLRFCLEEIHGLLDQTWGSHLHRLKSVVKMLGITDAAVRLLMSQQNGGPWLRPAMKKATNRQRETTYIPTAEIERFTEKYVTSALLCRELNSNFWAVQKALQANNVKPAIDPDWLGARVYLRADFAGQTSNLLFLTTQHAATKSGSALAIQPAISCAKSSKSADLGNPMVPSGESDASRI